MENGNPNPGDYRYRPASYQIGTVGGSWTASPYTTSMAINAAGDYTLTVTYAKDVYDGSSWNPDGTNVTKSITFHVVNALSVQTGDSSPLIPLAIAGGAALAVIILLIIVLKKRRK
jgi:LPXTG-motif cell wall-anchored protein